MKKIPVTFREGDTFLNSYENHTIILHLGDDGCVSLQSCTGTNWVVTFAELRGRFQSGIYTEYKSIGITRDFKVGDKFTLHTGNTRVIHVVGPVNVYHKPLNPRSNVRLIKITNLNRLLNEGKYTDYKPVETRELDCVIY